MAGFAEPRNDFDAAMAVLQHFRGAKARFPLSSDHAPGGAIIMHQPDEAPFCSFSAFELLQAAVQRVNRDCKFIVMPDRNIWLGLPSSIAQPPIAEIGLKLREIQRELQAAIQHREMTATQEDGTTQSDRYYVLEATPALATLDLRSYVQYVLAADHQSRAQMQALELKKTGELSMNDDTLPAVPLSQHQPLYKGVVQYDGHGNFYTGPFGAEAFDEARTALRKAGKPVPAWQPSLAEITLDAQAFAALSKAVGLEQGRPASRLLN